MDSRGWYKREFGLALHLINLSYSHGLFLSCLFHSWPFFLGSDFAVAFLRILQEVSYRRPPAPVSERARFFRKKILAMIRPIFHSRLPSKETLGVFSAHECHCRKQRGTWSEYFRKEEEERREEVIFLFRKCSGKNKSIMRGF